MEQKKIAYGGICCHVNGKAQFIKHIIKTDENAGRMLLKKLVDIKESSQKFDLISMDSCWMEVKTELTDEVLENLFNMTLAPKLLRLQKKGMTEKEEFLLRPVLEINDAAIEIDVIPFLAYALIKNERCRQMFEERMQKNMQEYYWSFKKSKYETIPFLSWFLMEERQLLKCVIGFLVQMQEEGECGERYHEFIEIISNGYRYVKNVMKKLDCLKGETFKIFMTNETMAFIMSRMVIQMVVAEELGIPIEYDYDACQVLLHLKQYERTWLMEPVKPEVTEVGVALYKKFKKEHPLLNSCYSDIFPSTLGECDESLDKIFKEFDLNLQMLEDFQLEKKECEVLLSLCENIKWEDYTQFLLIASLCKCICMMQETYEKNIPDEIIYQQWEKEEKKDKIGAENQQLEWKIKHLEKANQEQEQQIKELSLQKRKLEKRIKQMEESEELERRELIGLRNFIFQLGEETEELCDTIKEPPTYYLQDEKMIVVGGHENWQRKMKKYLPSGCFLLKGNHSVDTSVVANKKYIIFNTDVLDHALYYKIINQRKEEQKIVYVHGCNVEKTLQQIGRQM